MLLRCCGKFMVRTEPSVRTEILNMLWNQLRKSGVYASHGVDKTNKACPNVPKR